MIKYKSKQVRSELGVLISQGKKCPGIPQFIAFMEHHTGHQAYNQSVPFMLYIITFAPWA